MATILAKTALKEWGNSLAMRIPKKIQQALRLHDGSTINISLEGNKIILESDNDPFFDVSNDISLLSLVKKINKKNKHSADDFDDSCVGKEIW